MKKWLTFALVMGFMVVINLTTCDSGSSSSSTNSSTTSSTKSNGVKSVEALYGMYTAYDADGDKVEYTLKSESESAYTKFGSETSDNMNFKTSEDKLDFYTGKIKRVEKWIPIDSRTIRWRWDLEEGCVQIAVDMFDKYNHFIDLKGKKIYASYGEYLDKRNGLPYTFKKQ